MAETKAVPVGAKQDVVVTGKAVGDDAKGTITVTYNPGPGDPDETEVFGRTVQAGKAVDIPAKHADKVRGNPYLSLKGEKTYGDDRQPHEAGEEQEDASFEDNVIRERSEEYRAGRPLFAGSPGEAERVARAQDQLAEMRAAQKSDDKDKPARKKGH